MENTRKIILAVAFDEEEGNYIVDIPAGSSVQETAFGMAVVLKCLMRDGVIEKSADVLSLVEHYLSDPQYEEVTNDGDDEI